MNVHSSRLYSFSLVISYGAAMVLQIVILSIISTLVSAEPCEKVMVRTPRLVADCCLIKHEPDIVRIPFGPPPPRDGAPFHHIHFKREVSPKGFIGPTKVRDLPPKNCRQTRVDVQTFQGECCVFSSDMWINTLAELNDILSNGRFDVLEHGDIPDKVNNEKQQKISKNNTQQDKKKHTTAQQQEESNQNRNTTLTLTEMLSNMTAMNPLMTKTDKEVEETPHKVIPLAPPVQDDQGSNIVFPTEHTPDEPVDGQNENNVTANGNTTMEFPNRNFIDAPPVCPRGQSRDTSGNCIEVFE